jgi:hypothetical protein
MLLAVALDLRHAAIPYLPLCRIARPHSQLLRDVGGRDDTSGGDRQLAALCEDTIRNGQLPPCGTRGDGQLAGLGLKTGEPFLRPGFGVVDAPQLNWLRLSNSLLKPSCSLAAFVVSRNMSPTRQICIQRD